MRTGTLILAGFWSLCVLPISLAAQEAPPEQKRQATWVEIGTGLGYVQLDCSGCGPLPGGPPWQSGAGAALHVAAGVVLLPNLLVGGELNTYIRWTDAGSAQPRPGVNDRDTYLGQVGVTARYYPLAGTPLFVKAGAGLGGYRLEEVNRYTALGGGGGLISAPSYREHSDVQTLQTLAGALQAGVGYEMVIREDVALVPSFNVVQLYTGKVEREFRGRMVTAPRNPHYVQLGLAFRIYPERMSHINRPGTD